MRQSRWWMVAVAGAVIVVSVLVVVNPSPRGWTTPAAIGLLLAFGVFFAIVGPRAVGACADGPRGAALLQGVVVATVVVGTALSPNMATLQCVAFPLIWSLSPGPTMRRPIVLSTVMAAGTALGFWLSLGPSLDALVQGLLIEAVSLALGIGIGVWFTTEMRTGDENTRLLRELTAAQDQLAALHRESGAACERERLARELHDTIAQNLTSLVMLAQRGQNRDDPAGVRDDLELIEQVAREALTEARALVAAIAPVSVDGGLDAALGRLVATFERETRIRIAASLADAGEMAGLPRDHEVVLLRCAQEALANVRKHAHASRARLELATTATEVVLTVGDDGVGLGDAVPAESGFGIEGMRQRLALV
ncbi:MAG: sensor histidine kinase, partial [Herbiconiux sp.]|nr:sensor histidine kinase [Herbiconiux sp.]